jgi:hypothetical protein
MAIGQGALEGVGINRAFSQDRRVLVTESGEWSRGHSLT